MSEQFTSSPSPVVVQGRKVKDFPVLAPEAARGRVLRVTVVGEEVLHRPGTDVPAQMLGGAEL
ncbi:peptide deformylase, partial [Klebsiella pneumoniae]